MHKKIFLLVSFVVSYTVYSQNAIYYPLTIGKKVPNISLNYSLNEFQASSKVTNLRGKLIILDFWDIWCSSCVLSMPKMEALQQKFGNKIQIFFVTKNTKQEAEALFSKINASQPNLPMVFSDKILHKLFPHNTVPHHIWIDGQGIVKFITEGFNTTSKNISDFLEGSLVKLNYKNENPDIDVVNKPLISEINRLSEHLQYYSIIMNRIGEVGHSLSGLIKDTILSGIRMINQPVLNLYKVAFGENIFHGKFDYDNRVILEVENLENFKLPVDSTKFDLWNSTNLFSYESKLPLSRNSELYGVMQQDLNRYFPFIGRVEMKKVVCLVLKRISLNDKIISAGEKERLHFLDGGGVSIRNKSINDLIVHLNSFNYNLPTPIVDGTNYTGNIDIEIKVKLSDISNLRKELLQYDLDLVPEEKEIEMLIITDKDRNNHKRQ